MVLIFCCEIDLRAELAEVKPPAVPRGAAQDRLGGPAVQTRPALSQLQTGEARECEGR